jgi:hypothetical protein
LWDETRSRGPGFDDLETAVLKDVPVLIKVRTDEYEMLDRFITIEAKAAARRGCSFDFAEKCVIRLPKQNSSIIATLRPPLNLVQVNFKINDPCVNELIYKINL